MEKKTFKNIDEYIASSPTEIRELLEQIRQTIKSAAPEVEEVISYQMPAFKFHGILVYFAGYKNHIGFYPTSSGIAKFEEELGEFVVSKGTVRLPLNKPLPLDLITKIVKFRLEECKSKLEQKKNKKGNN